MSRNKAKGYDKFGNRYDETTQYGAYGKSGLSFSISSHDNPPPGSAGDGVNCPTDRNQFSGRGILNLFGGAKKLKLPPKDDPAWS